jgi:hypothetical protein
VKIYSGRGNLLLHCNHFLRLAIRPQHARGAAKRSVTRDSAIGLPKAATSRCRRSSALRSIPGSLLNASRSDRGETLVDDETQSPAHLTSSRKSRCGRCRSDGTAHARDRDQPSSAYSPRRSPAATLMASMCVMHPHVLHRRPDSTTTALHNAGKEYSCNPRPTQGLL